MNPPFKKLNNVQIKANFAKKLMQKFKEYCYNDATNNYYKIDEDVIYNIREANMTIKPILKKWDVNRWVSEREINTVLELGIWYRATVKKVKVKVPKEAKIKWSGIFKNARIFNGGVFQTIDIAASRVKSFNYTSGFVEFKDIPASCNPRICDEHVKNFELWCHLYKIPVHKAVKPSSDRFKPIITKIKPIQISVLGNPLISKSQVPVEVIPKRDEHSGFREYKENDYKTIKFEYSQGSYVEIYGHKDLMQFSILKEPK